MRLAEFIIATMESILVEWEEFAGSLLPGEQMTSVELRDDAESILRHTACEMEEYQSDREQESKSKGHGGDDSSASEKLDDASARHGAERVKSGFNIVEVVAEYRALRASVLRLWVQSHPHSEVYDIDDMERFNESLDQSLAGAVDSYSQCVNASRQMFLAILSHDLRNPLACIRMATDLISQTNDDPGSINWRDAINTNTDTILRLISDLVDYTSSELGLEMPFNPVPVNLNELCSEVIDSYHSTHPGRTLLFHSDGDISGSCDPDRLRQVISNLINNALQHGSPEEPVELSLALEGSTPEESMLVMSVHNEGEPIPPDALPTIFDPLKRYETLEEATNRTPGSIGLGLYIVRQIVVATGGTVEVVSTAEEGTTITVRVPQNIPVKSVNRVGAEAVR